ncbi:MAG: fibronectin type III domain-containing protein [Elusimicrobiota bacterium]
MNKYLRNLIKIFIVQLALCAGIFMPARGEVSAFTDVSVSIRPSHNEAPDPVTDLIAYTAAYDGETGKVDLSWSAPSTELDVDLQGYEIRYRKFSIEDGLDLGLTVDEWFENADKSQYYLSHSPGTPMDYTVGGLDADTTYYFAIKAVDEFDNTSDLDVKSSTETEAEQPWAISSSTMSKSIDPLNGSAGENDGEIDLIWDSVGGDEYKLRYSTKAPVENREVIWWETASEYSIEDTPASEGVQEEYVMEGLTTGATYYVALRMKWGTKLAPVGEVAKVVTGDSIPSAPTGIELECLEDAVKVKWLENTEPDINKYFIERRKIGENFQEVSDPDNSPYYDTGVKANNTYEYRLRVVDNTGNYSNYSDVKQVYTGDILQFDDIGLLRIKSTSDNKITLDWDNVSQSSDLKGYVVERSQNLEGPWSDVSFIYSTNTLRYTADLTEETYYYRVKSVSWVGMESIGSKIIDTSKDFNHYYVSEDLNAHVKLPYVDATELYPENNNGREMALSVIKEENEDYLLTYNMKVESGGKEINDFRFSDSADAKVVIYYDKLKDNEDINFETNKQPALYWFNGVKWIKLGGVRDSINQKIEINSKQLGKFALGLTTPVSGFELTTVEPKIFTPEEGDYRINEVSFYFENPEFSDVNISIFNSEGREIRSNLEKVKENQMVWDGTDSSGDIVKGGIYIYQVEVEGEVINGTIVIAK